MSKKNQVKKLIDDLVQDGLDFADLTQTTLTKMDGLQDVSKTTIKRAKKEYKQEKIVNKRDYKEQSIKRKIYRYLDRKPKSSLADLREALPGIQPSKVSEYHLYWKKKQSKAFQKDVPKKSVVSPRKLKEMIFKYLDNDNNATVETLYQQFPDAKQSSINSYFAGWKRKQKNIDRTLKGGLYEVIFKFLDRKPESTIDDIKVAFSDVPIKSIEIYHNLWLKEREENRAKSVSINDIVQVFIGSDPAEDLSGKSKKSAETSSQKADEVPRRKRGRPPRVADKAHRSAVIEYDPGDGRQKNPLHSTAEVAGRGLPNDADRLGISKSERKLIQKLQSSIETNNSAIDELEKEYQRLLQKQSGVIKELEMMRSDQILEIKNFIITYFKGLQSV
ncbi:hypothetical protein KKI24_02100 [bacterium]|nr:hypothetical protein [bacterium]